MRRYVIMSVLLAVLLTVSSSFGIYAPAPTRISIGWTDEAGASQSQTVDVYEDSELLTGNAKKGSVYLSGAEALKKYGLDGSGLTYFTMSYDTDPFVSGGFSFTNGTNSTQTYTVIFLSAVNPPVIPSTLYGGSMSGSFTSDPSAATVTTVPQTALYQGKIDGATLLTFYPDFSSWTAPAYASGDILAQNALPPTGVGPAANNNISIQFTFTLTPGDTATMNGAFVVIPEPATMVLLGLGSLIVFRRKL
jgi:hypothetical protein